MELIISELERNEDLVLPERPSPDGGEYVPAVSTSEEDEAWPGWDNNTVSTFSFVVY